MPADRDVSVIIPARNEERHVAAALASVTAQTWPLERLEVVVVDNGSADATSDVVRAFRAAQPRAAILLLSEPLAGVSRAKNRGARAAVGRWLIFLDADSRMASDLVEQVVSRARSGYPAGSIPIVADAPRSGVPVDRLDRAFFGLMEFGKRLFGLRAQMFYCERALFLRFGGFGEELRVAEDRDFLVRLERAGIPTCHVTESWIATSPRRLHALPWRLGLLTTLLRWALANWGIGRRWRY